MTFLKIVRPFLIGCDRMRNRPSGRRRRVRVATGLDRGKPVLLRLRALGDADRDVGSLGAARETFRPGREALRVGRPAESVMVQISEEGGVARFAGMPRGMLRCAQEGPRDIAGCRAAIGCVHPSLKAGPVGARSRRPS